MTVFRTNNPMQYAEVDGIVIDERAPDPSIRGVSTGVAILVGQFEQGPLDELTEPGSFDKIKEMFGTGSSGYNTLLNKRFSRLKIIRVGDPGEKATKDVVDSSNQKAFTVTAKEEGAAGNSITVVVAAGTNSGLKYTISDGTNSEEYDDQSNVNALFAAAAASELVDLSGADNSKTPVHGTITLSGGLDVNADDDAYQRAIGVAEAENAGNVLFLDVYNATRNGYLQAHAATTQDKMVICAGAEDELVTAAANAVAQLRDTDGRIIYAYNWLQTRIGGQNVYQSPASWVASVISNTGAHIDPAYVDNARYLSGVTRVRHQLTRAEFIVLAEAGIMGFQFDPDIGTTIKSGIVTQIADSSKITVIRRRMADWITNSIGRFLRNYQGAPNTSLNRQAAKNSILEWIQTQEQLGILPPDSEVQGGAAKVVDVETLNTDESIAEGRFLINYRQRIFSSMRFIVLIAEIGQSVVVTENQEG